LNKACDVKITVLRRATTDDIMKEYGRNMESQCPLFRVGDEFISEDTNQPEGFCSWAWADIQRDVAVLGLGGDFFWIKKKGTMISSCSDGLRPVIFKLERVGTYSWE